MKSFFVASALFVIVRSSDIAPVAVVDALPILQHSSQYHSQDSLGQYAYGYANGLSAKNEVRSIDGQTLGSYSYVDPSGKLQNVQYRSDPLNGFRVSSTNLPVGPPPSGATLILPQPIRDTPEVIEARTRHIEALKRAEEAAKVTINQILPQPIRDTPEVIEARTRHLEALKRAEEAAKDVEAKAAIRAHSTIITPTSTVVRSIPSFGYSFAIDYGKLYTIEPQPIVTAYAAPQAFIANPLIGAQASIVPTEVNTRRLPELVAGRDELRKDDNNAPAKE